MSFQSTSLLDSFERVHETPLYNAGQWLRLFTGESFPAGEINTSTSYSSGTGASFSAAYWTPSEYKNPAVAVKIVALSSIEGNSANLWGCVSHIPSGEESNEQNGYELRVLGEDPEGEPETNKFTFIAEKYALGEFEVLFEVPGVIITGVSDLIGLQVIGGKVEGWHKVGIGAWTEIGNASDPTFTSGRVGVGAAGELTHLRDFEVGGEEGEGPPIIENPGTKTSRIGHSVSFQLNASGTVEEWKEEHLPKGLTLAPSTGKITGTPETLETPKVIIKAKGPGGEDSIEFEWRIVETTARANQAAMIL